MVWMVVGTAKVASGISTEADARQMAASPEMRAALERVKEQAGWRGKGENPDIFYCEFCKATHEDSSLILHTEACAMTQVEAALAKARGKTP